EKFLEQISDLKIVKNRTFIASLYNAIKVKSHTLLTNSRNKLVLQGSQTDSFDPSHIFALGYTLAKIQGKILRNAEQVVVGDDINVVLIDAEVKANVTQIIKNKK
ncbi:MAG: hypothetical protein RR388_09085, partial [Rikenellaceae bacterium]